MVKRHTFYSYEHSGAGARSAEGSKWVSLGEILVGKAFDGVRKREMESERYAMRRYEQGKASKAAAYHLKV